MSKDSEQRSESNVTRTNQIGMEAVMATLTGEQQSLVWAVRIRGVAAPGTGFAGVVRIDFNRHTARQRGFVGDVAMQFSKGPLAGMPGCLSLLQSGFFAVRASGSLACMGEI